MELFLKNLFVYRTEGLKFFLVLFLNCVSCVSIINYLCIVKVNMFCTKNTCRVGRYYFNNNTLHNLIFYNNNTISYFYRNSTIAVLFEKYFHLNDITFRYLINMIFNEKIPSIILF